MKEKNASKARGALLGVCVGDALGVPVEFHPRFELEKKPVTEMRGFGTWRQPAGTWSDDSSLSLCLADSLRSGYDLNDVMAKFIQWRDSGLWTARGGLFDIGRTTRIALGRYKGEFSPSDPPGLKREEDNGNGSLMRILPLVFYIRGRPFQERHRVVSEVSSLTHAHPRSLLACSIYCETALALLEGAQPRGAYEAMRETLIRSCEGNPEVSSFGRILSGDIARLKEAEVRSSGYVVDTLEAALWCLLTTNNFRDAVLKAVNLGDDADTTGAVTGGLAGLAYGVEAIPSEWLEVLARMRDIEGLADELMERIAAGFA